MSSKSKARKRASTESDSDSGPDDCGPVKPPPSKKGKEAASDSKGGSKSSGTKQDDGSTQFEFSKNRFVTVREFKGKVYVDIREFYMDAKSGKLLPGKKGISMSGEQWRSFKGLIGEVDDALKNF